MKRNKCDNTEADDKWPSAFEITQIAIALCGLRKDDQLGIHPDPANYFPAAGQLLDSAQAYLKLVRPNPISNRAGVKDAMGWGLDTPDEYRDLNREIPFDFLLRSVDEPSEGKKRRTWVGAITTTKGLQCAIHRYFSKTEAKRANHSRTLTYHQYERLLNAQRDAITHRAAERVKGGTIKKSQPA